MRTVIRVAMASILLVETASAQVGRKVLNSISTPNEVQPLIGTLKFLDGAPCPEATEKAYDYIDTMRGVDVFLRCIPAARCTSSLKETSM